MTAAPIVLHHHLLGDPDGPRLLAIHGVTGHALRWRRSAEEGWPHRRTLAVDLRGHGHSPAPGPWTVDQQVADVIETMQAVGWQEPIDVVGHSFGGMIAAWLLAQRPDLIRRLVLLDPALELHGADALARAREVIEAAGWASPEEAAIARSEGLDGPGVHPAVPEELEAHLELRDDGNWWFRYERAAAVTAWGEMCHTVPAIPVGRPTLLVRAAHAPFVGDRQVQTLRQRLGSVLEIAELDCGHMVYWDRFSATVELVNSHLDGG